ncbi:MAG: methytransferase partner Trm112 [Candidatus Thermoplasmatota archaeon]
MKKDLMSILCCPLCKGELDLKIEEEKEEIEKGKLNCKKCNIVYEIENGIPEMIPKEMIK